MRNKQEKSMSIAKCFVQNSVVVSVLLVTALNPLATEASSESDRLEKLERAVEQLQKRNVELEAEVRSLKQETAAVPDGKFKTKMIHAGKTYVEKAVPQAEKPPLFVHQRGPELKLVLGGFIQVNFEDGAVSAFEGRFGQTAIDDRFRLRRARINLTGDFAEQFYFKMEGDFGQSDGTSGNRTAFSATDVWINWHQFPAAQIKIGQYKAPFGVEQLTPDTALLTIERTLPTAQSPQLGKSVPNFGESRSRAFGRSRRSC
jgi:cell division protein FtsB